MALLGDRGLCFPAGIENYFVVDFCLKYDNREKGSLELIFSFRDTKWVILAPQNIKFVVSFRTSYNAGDGKIGHCRIILVDNRCTDSLLVCMASNQYIIACAHSFEPINSPADSATYLPCT